MSPEASATRPAAARSEARLAWTATVLLALHSCWVGFIGFRYLPNVASLHDGLGIEEPLPAVQDFFSTNPSFFLGLYIAIAAALVLKEFLMADKRRSILITCLAAVFLLVVLDVSRLWIMEPVFRLIGQLAC